MLFLSVIPLESHLARTKREAECCRSNWPEQKSAFLHGAQKDKAKNERKRKIKKKKKRRQREKKRIKGKKREMGKGKEKWKEASPY